MRTTTSAIAAALALAGLIGCAPDEHDLRLHLRVGQVFRYDLVHGVSRHAYPDSGALDFVEIGAALKLEVVEARPAQSYVLRVTVERLRVERGSPEGGVFLDSIDRAADPAQLIVEVSARATDWSVRGLDELSGMLGGEEAVPSAFREALSDEGFARLGASLFRPRPDGAVAVGEVWSDEGLADGAPHELSLYEARKTERRAGRECLWVRFETRLGGGAEADEVEGEAEGTICIDLATGLPLSSGILTELKEDSALVHRNAELTLRDTR